MSKFNLRAVGVNVEAISGHSPKLTRSSFELIVELRRGFDGKFGTHSMSIDSEDVKKMILSNHNILKNWGYQMIKIYSRFAFYTHIWHYFNPIYAHLRSSKVFGDLILILNFILSLNSACPRLSRVRRVLIKFRYFSTFHCCNRSFGSLPELQI